MPPKDVVVEALLGSRWYRAAAGAAEESVRLDVPHHGTLCAAMSLVGPSYGPSDAPGQPTPQRIHLQSDPIVAIRSAAEARAERLLTPGIYVLEDSGQTFTVKAGATTVLQN